MELSSLFDVIGDINVVDIPWCRVLLMGHRPLPRCLHCILKDFPHLGPCSSFSIYKATESKVAILSAQKMQNNFQVSNQLLLMLAAQFKIMSNHNHVQYPVAMNPIFEEYCSSITQWRNVYKLVIIMLSQWICLSKIFIMNHWMFSRNILFKSRYCILGKVPSLYCPKLCIFVIYRVIEAIVIWHLAVKKEMCTEIFKWEIFKCSAWNISLLLFL